jgi:hypothetical protein
MNIDKMVMAFAGCVVLASVALGLLVHPYWFGLTVFAGVNLLQAAFTGFCPAAMVFKRFGARPGQAFR